MDTLHCGFAQSEITPTVGGVFLDGFGFRLAPAAGVRDPLFAKAAYFVRGEARFAIISLDICALTDWVYDILCFHLEQIGGLSRDEFVICATHTHSGPSTGLLTGLPVSLDYWHGVGQTLCKLVRKARASAAAAEISSGLMGEWPYVENRRGGDLLSPKLRAVSVKTAAENISFVQAACHPVINRTPEFSADYPGELYRRAENTIFLQGCAGDVRPCFGQELSDGQKMELLGGYLAQRLSRFRAESPHAAADSFCAVSFPLEIPMKRVDADSLNGQISEAAEAYYAESEPVNRHIALQRLHHLLTIKRRAQSGDSFNINTFAQLLCLGDALLCFLPFEVFTETGMSIEGIFQSKGVNAEKVFAVSCANAVYGYLAPKSELKRGGYEITASPMWLGTSGCGEQSESELLNAVRRAADDII